MILRGKPTAAGTVAAQGHWTKGTNDHWVIILGLLKQLRMSHPETEKRVARN